MSTHYTGWNRPLLVLLTDTDNPYLRPRLPLVGLLTVNEMGTHHKIINASFRVADDPRTLDGFSAPVQVKRPVFTYPVPED